MLRRAFLGLVSIAVIAGVGWAVYHGFSADKKNSEAGALATPDTGVAHAVYCARVCMLVNNEGVTQRQTARPGGNLILVIDNEHATPPTAGEKVIEPHIIAELLFLRQALLEEHGIQLGTAMQSRLSPEDFEFETNKGWLVRLSTANNAYATLEILGRTVEKLSETPVAYIDLRIENRVYYKPL